MTGNSTQYEAITPLGNACVQITFTGDFNNTEILWHAELCSLEYVAEHYANRYNKAQQFLDVRIENNRHEIRIGLALRIINHADILKSIIMVRQYKLLKSGIHWFGQNLA